jgi:O-antigen ligase
MMINRIGLAGVSPQQQVTLPAAPAANSLAAAAWNAQYYNILRRCSFYASLALLFTKVSVLQELIGTSLMLLHFLTPPAVLGVLLSGGIGRTLQRRAAWYWIAFGVWLVMAVPFSSWAGGSASHLMYYFRDQLVLVFLAAGSIMGWKECGLTVRCLALAALVDIVFVQFSMRSNLSDRLQLSSSSTIANANDLAAHLLFVVCFLLYFVLRPRSRAVLRLFAGGFIIVALYAVMRTGSRGGLVAMVVGVLVLLTRLTPRQRITGVVLSPIIVIGLLFAIPQATLVRITSFSEDSGSAEAAMSKDSREYLLRKSIEFTLANPLFGVGMGQFSTYEGTQSRSVGETGNWHETHNSYTQVSSECGIPALLLYLGAIVSTVGLLLRVSRKARAAQHSDMYTACTCLILAIASFCTAMAFLSVAYRFYLPLLTGLAIALAAAADRELAPTHNPR